MILFHRVFQDVLSSTKPDLSFWMQAISTFFHSHMDLMEKMDCTITAEVTTILKDIENQDILKKLNFGNSWKFSEKEAKTFAAQFNKCIENHL